MNQITELPVRDRLTRSADRCDRCGVEALVRVVITSTRLPLLFCGHHFAESANVLHRVAIVTHDDRLFGSD
jgi:ribosomal protein S14